MRCAINEKSGLGTQAIGGVSVLVLLSPVKAGLERWELQEIYEIFGGSLCGAAETESPVSFWSNFD